MTQFSRRLSLVAVPLLAGILTLSLFPPDTTGADVANLREQLEKGLRARTPADFAFLDTVVTMTANQELPLDLVQSSFLWVRKNRAHKRYLVAYFEQVLRRRAANRGIDIP